MMTAQTSTQDQTTPAPLSQREQDLTAQINALGVTITAEFVPWSRSRSFKAGAHPKDQSLNWRVTLHKDGRAILTTDYMAGIGHCPSYAMRGGWTQDKTERIAWECDKGTKAAWPEFSTMFRKGSYALLPSTPDVLHSLLLDSDVLDHPSFESWASDFGYDADSRSAEKTYQACMTIALQLRAGLGDSLMAALRDLLQDY